MVFLQGDLHPGGLYPGNLPTVGDLPTGGASTYMWVCLKGGLHLGISLQGGLGRPTISRTRKVGGTHPTGMLSC